MVKVELDRSLVPSYLALAKNYSQYVLDVAFNSSSPYVMKLYQFVSHWKDKRKITVQLEDLRTCILEPTAVLTSLRNEFRDYFL